MKRAISIILFTVSLFFIINTSANTTVKTSDYLKLSKTIESVKKNDDKSITIAYKIIVKNVGDVAIKDLVVKDDLKKAFKGYPFTIIEKSASLLTLNPGYDGLVDTKLITGNPTLEKNQEFEIKLKTKFFPGDNKGPFINDVDGEGKLANNKPTDNKPKPGDGGEGNGGEEKPPGDNPPPIEEPEKDLTPRKYTFYLVDATTDQIIKEIKEGDVINIDDIPGGKINIKIGLNKGNKGSLVLDLNGKKKYAVENYPMYALGGNNGNDFKPWNYTLGDQSLTVTSFTEKGGKGQLINGTTINFKIIGSDTSEDDGDTFTVDAASVTFEFPEDEVVTPPGEEVPEEEGRDLVIVKEGDNEVRPPRVLAATGFNLSESLLVGMILVLAVLELNFFEIEDRFLVGIFRSLKAKLQNRKLENDLKAL